jgi:15-cis-phytoene synthase
MAGSQASQSAHAAETVRQAAATHAYDDYLVALLAPKELRSDLIALAAYLGDIRRIPFTVSEPHLGEIRLQWWRDTLQTGSSGGNPVAEAVIDAAVRRGWSRALLADPLDALAAELYPEPFSDDAAFERYVAGLDHALLKISVQTFAAPSTAETEQVIEHAAQGLGRVRVLRRLPHLLSLGRCPMPVAAMPEDAAPERQAQALRNAVEKVVADAQRHQDIVTTALRRAPATLRQALLQVSLARPYLRAMQGQGYDPLHDLADISPITRVSTLWLAKLRSRA